jgi:hypothetical protein
MAVDRDSNQSLNVKIILMKENSRKNDLENIKINLKQDHEVQYWSRKWGISTLQLEMAVKATGSKIARDVEEYLKVNGKL